MSAQRIQCYISAAQYLEAVLAIGQNGHSLLQFLTRSETLELRSLSLAFCNDVAKYWSNVVRFAFQSWALT